MYSATNTSSAARQRFASTHPSRFCLRHCCGKAMFHPFHTERLVRERRRFVGRILFSSPLPVSFVSRAVVSHTPSLAALFRQFRYFFTCVADFPHRVVRFRSHRPWLLVISVRFLPRWAMAVSYASVSFSSNATTIWQYILAVDAFDRIASLWQNLNVLCAYGRGCVSLTMRQI